MNGNLRMLLFFWFHLVCLGIKALSSPLPFRWSCVCCKTAPTALITRHDSQLLPVHLLSLPFGVPDGMSLEVYNMCCRFDFPVGTGIIVL